MFGNSDDNRRYRPTLVVAGSGIAPQADLGANFSGAGLSRTEPLRNSTGKIVKPEKLTRGGLRRAQEQEAVRVTYGTYGKK